ncbi:thioesterase family protein [Kordiimonas lacus]|uniref:Acyl-CoA thioesterase n=1 Tax=Kordiimonas lacus TaxID=637679 RepID=A0A1G6TU78_9PROT|nr:thioesterase family protein [Kordiimonas lacus]SDD32722.1 Acyl-CoA thioesterase [Kordiimonas lacus]
MTDRTMAEILADIDGPEAMTQVTPLWMQGRAAFGGLGAAMAATGMRQVLPEEKPMRSLMVSFVGPIPAEAVTVRSELLREGKNVSQATARVLAGDAVCLQASAAFGSARDTKAVAPAAAFRPEPRDSVPPMDPSRTPLPSFLQNFDIHWTGDGIPTSNTGARRLGKWVRHKSDMSAFPVEKIIAVADIPPPLMMAHYDRRIMASSLSWSLEFVVPAHEVNSDWFYLDYSLEAAAGGYCQQSGQIFTESGDLVALSRQCMTYFE